MTHFSLTDSDDCTLAIQTGAGAGQRAFIHTLSSEECDGVWVLPHQVPAVCRALYDAAGLDVPDLPGIPDPALAGQLAADIAAAVVHGGPADHDGFVNVARDLLARGWGRTS